MSELTRRYARALWQVAPDQQTLERTARAMMDSAPLWQALTAPSVHGEEKARVLARLPLLDGHPLLLGFYTMLARKGRMDLLPQIVADFSLLALAQRGEARCVMTCAHPPAGEELERLGRALCRLHHKDHIQFEVRRDPDLLGGFTLELEGVTYDKSVRGALERLGQTLEVREMA